MTHLAPQSRLPDLENTVKFFPLALGLFEGQLGASFPFPSYHQVREPSPRCSCYCSQTLLTTSPGSNGVKAAQSLRPSSMPS